MKKKILVLIALILTVAMLVGCNSSDYKAAEKLMESKDYAAAASAFEALGDYKDSADKAIAARYALAAETQDNGNYEEAKKLFAELGSYEDSKDRVTECSYQLAKKLFDAKDYAAAETAFAALGDYKDSKEICTQAAELAFAAAVEGEWVSVPYDLWDKIFGAAMEAAGSDAEEMFRNIDKKEFNLVLNITIKDGKFEMSADEEAEREAFATIKTEVAKAASAYFADLITQMCEAEGLSLETLYLVSGVKNMDELLTMALGGMTMEQYAESIFTEEMLQEMLTSMHEEGTVRTEDGKIIFEGENNFKDTAEFDKENDTFSIQPDIGFEVSLVFYRKGAKMPQ